MGLLDKILNKKQPEKPARTLLQDIEASSEWVVMALNRSGYKADYTLESMKEIDRFFDEQSSEGGIISMNRGQILFALSSYVGQTVIKLYGGKWLTDDNDPQGELKIAVELSNGTIIWPAQRCMKRYANGAEDSIYAYVYVLDKKSNDNNT